MASQVVNGKAFEWAFAIALTERGFLIKENPSAMKNQECFNKVSQKQRDIYSKNARSSVEHILHKEAAKRGNFWFLSDEKGIKGDVRDIVIHSDGREIGISCKTNHDAFKHPRLSDTSDFIKKWGLNESGCSDEYWTTIKPLFQKLRSIKKSSNSTELWANLDNVPTNYYWPVLDAFEKEVLKHNNADMCKRFVEYIVGNKDFYKVISKSNEVQIYAFNLSGTLKVQPTKLPTKIDLIKSENGSQYAKTIAFNHGWIFNFRIHNASSRVEPSLKFDVTAISLSPKLYRHHIDT